MAKIKPNMGLHQTLAGAAVIFILVAGFKAVPVIAHLQKWDAGYSQPDIAAQFIEAGLYGLAAFAAACGMNLSTVLSGFGINVTTTTPPSPNDPK